MKGTRTFIFAKGTHLFTKVDDAEYEGARPLHSSERNQHHAAVGQVLVDAVELCAAFRADRVREREEAALAAGALADAPGRERAGVTLDDRERQRAERLRVPSHHLDREVAGKPEQLVRSAHRGSSVENSRCVALKAAKMRR